MCLCLSEAVVPQHTVLLRLLSSAMLVTPGPLPVRRCWWDGSLTGPAAAPDMLLIYNAQLWQRNQPCLYAKLGGARSWWEMSHSLSLFHTDTHFMLWLYLNDTHRGVPVRCCCCCAECNGGRLAGTPHHDAVKPDEMKYIPIMICRWGCGREKKKKTVSETDKNQFSSAWRNHDNEFSC